MCSVSTPGQVLTQHNMYYTLYTIPELYWEQARGASGHACTCAHRLGNARRIDCFSEWTGTAAFGEKMKEQVEERLRFYDEGIAPSKNVTAMQVLLVNTLFLHH